GPRPAVVRAARGTEDPAQRPPGTAPCRAAPPVPLVPARAPPGGDGLGGDRRAGRLRAADRRAGRVPGLDRRLAAGGGRPGAGRRHHRAPAERGPRALDPARRGAGGHLLRAVPRPLAAADPPPRPDGAGARRAARRTGADPALPAAGLAADPAGRHARAALAV